MLNGMEVSVSLAHGTEWHNSQFHRDISDRKTYARAAGGKTKTLVQHFDRSLQPQQVLANNKRSKEGWHEDKRGKEEVSF